MRPNPPPLCGFTSTVCWLADTLLEKQGDDYVGKYQLDAAGVTMMVTALEGLRDADVVNNIMFRASDMSGSPFETQRPQFFVCFCTMTVHPNEHILEII